MLHVLNLKFSLSHDNWRNLYYTQNEPQRNGYTQFTYNFGNIKSSHFDPKVVQSIMTNSKTSFGNKT